MAKREIVAGTTNQIWLIKILDSSQTDGRGLTGLTNASAGLTVTYKRTNASASVAVTTINTISTLGGYAGSSTACAFKEIDATLMKGWYEFHPPNNALATSAQSVGFQLQGATNMAQCDLEVELIAFDLYSGTVIASSVTDKTGYALSAAGVDLVTLSEPSASIAFGTVTLRTALAWLYARTTNKMLSTSAVKTLRNRADTSNISTASHSDDGTTYNTGPWS